MKYILIIILIYIIISYIMFLFLSASSMNGLFKVIDKKIEKTLLPYKDITLKGINWIKNKELEQVTIKSFDNINLEAKLLKNKKEKYMLILVHGYRSTPQRDLYSGLKYYYDMGCSILIINSRACHSSEGKYITFGYKESKDINSWINYIHDKDGTPIILGGISLGATSVLMTNNKYVKLVLADCPFDDAYKEVKYVIHHYFHLPAFMFMGIIDVFFKIFVGKSLKKINVYSSLNKKDVPILLFHGINDEFVPCDNSKRIYDFYKGNKEIHLFEGADHGMSFLVDNKRYISTLKKFINKYMV